MKEIYLDNAATTKARKEVVNYMVDCMEHSYANADSIHNLGLSVAKKINDNKKVFEKTLAGRLVSFFVHVFCDDCA